MKTTVLALSIAVASGIAPIALAQTPTAATSCTPEHAAKGHCTLPQTPAGAHDRGTPAAPVYPAASAQGCGSEGPFASSSSMMCSSSAVQASSASRPPSMNTLMPL